MTDDRLRLPPQNLDAERGVIGSILLMPSAIDEIAGIVSASDFYGFAHQILFTAISGMHRAGSVAIDPVTLADDLQKSGKLEDVGGVGALFQVLDSVPHAAHVRYYANIVREKSKARGLIYKCTEALNAAYESSDPLELIDDHARAIDALRESENDEVATAADAVESLAEHRANPKQVHRTGISKIDQKLNGGFRDGDLIAVGGRPGTGKTVLLSQLCQGVISAGEAALIVSLEMTKEELIDRMSTSIPLDTIAAMPLLFIDSVFEFERIAALIRSTARQRKLGIVAVDYIQLCEITLGRNDTREREIATMSRRFKKLAKSLKVPIVIGSQLNRESTKRGKPTLADMRESGAIEQDASVVILLSKSEDDEETLIDIAKHRGGPTGEIRMNLNGPKFRFEDGYETYDRI